MEILEAIDKAFVEMLKRKKFEINVVDDGDVYIEDEKSMYQLSYGELTCMHQLWERETYDVHGSTPDQPDTTVEYAWCPDCAQDVTEEVGFYENKEDE